MMIIGRRLVSLVLAAVLFAGAAFAESTPYEHVDEDVTFTYFYVEEALRSFNAVVRPCDDERQAQGIAVAAASGYYAELICFLRPAIDRDVILLLWDFKNQQLSEFHGFNWMFFPTTSWQASADGHHVRRTFYNDIHNIMYVIEWYGEDEGTALIMKSIPEWN